MMQLDPTRGGYHKRPGPSFTQLNEQLRASNQAATGKGGKGHQVAVSTFPQMGRPASQELLIQSQAAQIKQLQLQLEATQRQMSQITSYSINFPPLLKPQPPQAVAASDKPKTSKKGKGNQTKGPQASVQTSSGAPSESPTAHERQSKMEGSPPVVSTSGTGGSGSQTGSLVEGRSDSEPSSIAPPASKIGSSDAPPKSPDAEGSRSPASPPLGSDAPVTSATSADTSVVPNDQDDWVTDIGGSDDAEGEVRRAEGKTEILAAEFEADEVIDGEEANYVYEPTIKVLSSWREKLAGPLKILDELLRGLQSLQSDQCQYLTTIAMASDIESVRAGFKVRFEELHGYTVKFLKGEAEGLNGAQIGTLLIEFQQTIMKGTHAPIPRSYLNAMSACLEIPLSTLETKISQYQIEWKQSTTAYAMHAGALNKLKALFDETIATYHAIVPSKSSFLPFNLFGKSEVDATLTNPFTAVGESF